MPSYREIRAKYDPRTIVVYQAYNDAIADAALAAGRFVPPFSTGRMTWIKPSFLWMMGRSGWATKPNQTRVLAVRVTRTGWERALGAAVLTSCDPRVYRDHEEWRALFKNAPVHVQWDPERSFAGATLDHRSIQVGLSRAIVEEYVNDWIKEITDMTDLTRKIRTLQLAGKRKEAARLLPSESVYPVSSILSSRLGMT